MARFTIYSADGTVKCSGTPQYSGSYMGVDFLEFRKISSPTPIDWQRGDYVDYTRTGMRYRLYSIPMPKKVARTGDYGGSIEYSGVKFYAATKDLEIAPFRDLAPDDNRIHFSTRPDVSTYEDVYGIARRLQECMNDLFPNRWRIEVYDTSDSELSALLHEVKEYSVSGGSCLDALSHIYELWENVGWIHTYDSATGEDVITIGRANVRDAQNTSDVFSYGKGNGLTFIKKAAANEEEFATRLYVYGSERNLQTRYYNGKDIVDNDSVDIRNLMIPLDEWGTTNDLPDARKAYLQADDAIVEKYGLIPRTIYFDGNEHDEIYPSIVGLTEAQVRQAMIDAGEGGSQYLPADYDVRIDEVFGSMAPDDYGQIVNPDGSVSTEGLQTTFLMDINNVGFDIVTQAALADEVGAVISMKTGKCAGREFPVKSVQWEGGTWLLTLERELDDSLGMLFPNNDYLISQGDQFVLLNIAMPEYYITLASERLLEAGRKTLADYTRVSAFYEPGINPIAMLSSGKLLHAGMFMQVYDEDVVDTENNTDYILIDTLTIDESAELPQYKVTLREQKRSARSYSALEDMIDDVRETTSKELRQNMRYTDRRFRSAQESLTMLQEAFTNFSEGISPVTVQTMALLIGDESLQFKFTNSLSSLTDVECPLTYDNTTKQLAASSISYIKHMTLGVNAVSSSREASEFKGWRIPTFSGVLEDAEARYIYIKASKSSTTGAFVMSKTAIGMEDVSEYYHFLVGILNSEYNSSRDFVTLYGFTEVLPGQITTDVIRSGNGKLVIDLANALITAQSGATIIGNVTIGAGSSGLTNLSEWNEKQIQIDTASTNASEAKQVADIANASVVALGETVEGLDKTIEEINHKLDGVVESFFDDYTPSRTNEPAATWIAEGTEANHIGDTFTNTALEGEDAGKSWRWLEQSDGTYDWQQIADSDAAKALALAGQAQATADGKSTTFLVKPNRAYGKGDIWIVGEDYIPSGYEVGDILSAIKGSSTYIESHWSKVVRYTDDTAAEEAQSAAAKAQQKAEDAEEVAQNAKNALDGLLEDGLIQKFELQSFQSEYASINADKLTIDADVLRYGLSENAAYTSFSESFTSYNTTLENIIGATSYPIAVPSGLIANRNAYYGTRSDLLKVIAEAAKEVADEAKAAANDAQERAEQAAANAAAAQEKADSAEGIASSAKERIDELIADAIITRSEADIFAIELRSIVAEKSSIDADVERYVLGSNASYTSYSGAYTNYYNILSTITNATEFPISAPDELVPYRNAYYGTRTSILNDIAAAAKRVADDAQDAADEANGTLSDWLSDGVITPVEKQALRNELARINEEYATIIADAVRYELEGQAYYDYEYVYPFYRDELERIIEAEGTQDGTTLSTYQSEYYEEKKELLERIESAAKSVVDGMTYLTETFGNGNNLHVTGAVLSQMVAVSNSAGEIEAFINGSDVGKDDTNGKLLIAAGIDDITTPETSKTRVYENGIIISNLIQLLDGCKIGDSIRIEDGKIVIDLADSLGVLYMSQEGIHYEGAGTASLGGCGGAALQGFAKGVSGYCPVLDKSIGVQGEALDGEYAFFSGQGGVFGGLRPSTRVITTAGTSASPNALNSIDFSVLVSSTSGTYYIELPDEPLDGQEYVLESMGASMIVTSAKEMWSHYYGQFNTGRTFTGSCSIRFKYYSEAQIWTYSWLDWVRG